MSTVIPKCRWRKVNFNGEPAVRVMCPGCDNSYLLDHTIDSAGNISPSLDCPTCEFHDMARLAGWPWPEEGLRA